MVLINDFVLVFQLINGFMSLGNDSNVKRDVNSDQTSQTLIWMKVLIN